MLIRRYLIDHMQPALSAMTPQRIATESFTDADAAVDRLIGIYERNTGFLRDRFEAYVNGEALDAGACYVSLCAHLDIYTCAP
jgi:hypothetical protein